MTALHDRVAAALADGFVGTPTELATLLSCPVKAVYVARAAGFTWRVGGPLADRRYGDWTVIEEAPSRNGQSCWVVRCTCGVVVTRYVGDITGGRSTRCHLSRAEHGLLVQRRLARSVQCPTCGSRRACVDTGTEGRGVTFSYGVHVARATLAGCEPLPCAGDLDRGLGPFQPDGLAERLAADTP